MAFSRQLKLMIYCWWLINTVSLICGEHNKPVVKTSSLTDKDDNGSNQVHNVKTSTGSVVNSLDHMSNNQQPPSLDSASKDIPESVAPGRTGSFASEAENGGPTQLPNESHVKHQLHSQIDSREQEVHEENNEAVIVGSVESDHIPEIRHAFEDDSKQPGTGNSPAHPHQPLATVADGDSNKKMGKHQSVEAEITDSDKVGELDLEKLESVPPLEGQQIELQEEVMPSFDEWKQKEQQKTKTVDDNTPTAQHATAKTTKKNVNYASVTCGAKIVSANPEAQNALFVLMENKDMYMINPCKARKVFTVELCEPVQVQMIEIGNLELFSSLPHSVEVNISDRFVSRDIQSLPPHSVEVNISDRYPAKEWTAIGTFEARDERTIQAFQIVGSALYAKYIRIEVLSHYGSEHYCPISILRVFGLALDDDDDDDDDNQSNDNQNVDEELASNGNPTNLFSTATDTVLSIVKTVLSPSNGENEVPKEAAKLAQEDLTTAQSDCQPPHCVDGLESALHGEALSPDVSQETLTEASGEKIQEKLNPEKLEHDISSSEEVEAQEPLKPRDLVILVETPGIPLDELLDECDELCENGRDDVCLSGLCGYFQVAKRRVKFSCVGATPQQIMGEVSGTGGTLGISSTCGETHDIYVNDIVGLSPPPLLLPGNASLNASFANDSEPFEQLSRVAGQSNQSLVANKSDDSRGSAVDVPASENVKSAENQAALNVRHGNGHEGNGLRSPAVVNGNGVKKVIYPDSASKLETPVYDLEGNGGALDDIAYQRLARAGKETLYGKLKNRIRTLEVNLNLTNRYLEELSRRYKRQMEDMYTSLNRTITKLSNTAKLAEDKDHQQSDRITTLESKLVDLMAQLSEVGERFESSKSQLVERHMILMSIEVTLFVFIVLFVVKRYSRSPSRIPSKPSLSDAGAKTSPLAIEDVSSSDCIVFPDSRSHITIERRRSDSSHLRSARLLDSASRSLDLSMMKSGSENDLSSIEQNIPIFLTKSSDAAGTTDFNKKHRKKKKAQVKVARLSRTSSEHGRAPLSSSVIKTGSSASSVYSADENCIDNVKATDIKGRSRVRSSLPIENLSGGSLVLNNGALHKDKGADESYCSPSSSTTLHQRCNSDGNENGGFIRRNRDFQFDRTSRAVKLSCL